MAYHIFRMKQIMMKKKKRENVNLSYLTEPLNGCW